MNLKSKKLNSTNKLEIMAPVGSPESLTAALKAGCDSIYFGVEQLNMRSRSSTNFSLEDLVNITEQCRTFNVRTYLTINTILYDHDLTLMRSIVETAKSSGVSAIIASDHAVMAHAQKLGMPVHISTQANVTNIESVDFYSHFADVMVLSRELSLSQVGKIVEQIRERDIRGPSGELIRVEIFAHGALCMAVSGKCYLSLHSHNASANRGACVQNCRREYVVTDKEDGVELEIDNEYIMSAKDLCTIGFLDKIVEAGISILKIEGRGRSADYVDTTVTCYKEAVSAISDDCYTSQSIGGWMTRLSTVFNRGFWDGYYLGRKMGEWNNIHGSKATERRVLIGRGKKYFKKINVAEFQLESNQLKVGDQILISGPTTGVIKTTVEELRVDDSSVNTVTKGTLFSTPISEPIRSSDKLYKILPVG